MIIRPVQPPDHAAVGEVIRAAFGRVDEARLVARLRSDGDAEIERVAELDGSLVGQTMLSRMSAPFRALGLAPLAVRPDRQKRGFGAGLVEAGLAAATAGGWDAVFVLGDPEYYRRFGFRPGPAEGFASPYAGPFLMVHTLGRPLPAKVGRIDYAPAFAGLG